MAIPKPITRVEQYLASIAGASNITLPAYPITREEYYLASWAEKSGFEIAEVDGTPPLVLKDCIGEPFNGVVLYGKSTQVTTTGAQLLDIPDTERTIRGVTLRVQNGVIEMNGTATENGYAYMDIAKTQLTGTYTLSIDGAVKGALLDDRFQRLIESTASLNGKTARMLTFYIIKDVKYSLTGIKVMLNAGDTALPWEPYTGGKPSPSPDYPQEIVSAEGKVIVSGKNLLNIENSSNSDGGLKTVIDDGVITINGVTTSASYIWNFCTFTCEVDGTYALSANNNIGSKDARLIFNVNNGSLLTAYPYAKIELKHDDVVRIFLRIDKENYSLNNVKVRPQLEYGSEATDYEPYHAKQTITLTAPTSLPGIPASSGGNYTDENGQQWICDEVNLERGVYVQRINELAFDQLSFSYEKTPVNHNDTWIASIDERLSGTETGHAMCQYAYFDGASYELAMQEDCRCYVWRNNVTIQFRDSVGVNTLEAFAEWLISHPKASISYVLATPIETQLSEADIAAYRALTTYKGTTILESECHLKVKYSKLRK